MSNFSAISWRELVTFHGMMMSTLPFVVFSVRHAALNLRRKNKDWLAQNQDNVSEWSNMFVC
jgi:hypothetical protein